jgi:hypothetical protein
LIPVEPRFWTAIKLTSTVPNPRKGRQTDSRHDEGQLVD